MLVNKIFPTNITTFYRAYHLVMSMAAEFIHMHLPNCSEETHDSIISFMFGSYITHNSFISRSDLSRLGLNVDQATNTLETLVWELYKSAKTGTNKENLLIPPDGLVMTSKFTAKYVTGYEQKPSPNFWQVMEDLQ